MSNMSRLRRDTINWCAARLNETHKIREERRLTSEEQEGHDAARECLEMEQDLLEETKTRRELTKEEKEDLADIQWCLKWDSMTIQQRRFYTCKQRLNELDEKKKAGTYGESDREDEDRIKESLLNLIIRFAWGEAKKRMPKYELSGDAYDEVNQEFALIFYERLPYYDPLRSAPTTYFLPYFNQVISEYLLQNSQHLSQYDAANISKVRGAIAEMESMGRSYDEATIAAKTNLSQKVVHRTMDLAAHSRYGNVEDEVGLQSSEPSPEKQYLEKEKEETIQDAIESMLTDSEYEFFMYKVNLDGPKERNFQAVAEHFGIPARTARQRWGNITRKLSKSRDLKEYRQGKSHAPETIVYQKGLSDYVDGPLMEAICKANIRFSIGRKEEIPKEQEQEEDQEEEA